MHHKISRIVVSNYIWFDWMGGIDLESTVPGNLIPLGADETTGYRIKHLSVAKPESDSLPNQLRPCSVLGCATFNLTDDGVLLKHIFWNSCQIMYVMEDNATPKRMQKKHFNLILYFSLLLLPLQGETALLHSSSIQVKEYNSIQKHVCISLWSHCWSNKLNILLIWLLSNSH